MFGSAIIERERSTGKLYISQTYNKMNFKIYDMEGNELYCESVDGIYYIRHKTFVAREKANKIAQKLNELQIKNIDVVVNGFGVELMAILVPITSQGIKLNKIKNITPIVHNGGRRPKRRK